MIPIVMDLSTQKTRKVVCPPWIESEYSVEMGVAWWEEIGNGHCDCQRAQIFYGESAQQCGKRHFVVVDVVGALEGESKNEILRWINDGYPAESIAAALEAYRIQHEGK